MRLEAVVGALCCILSAHDLNVENISFGVSRPKTAISQLLRE